MKNIMIVGSCVSRDIFRLSETTSTRIVEYTARSSFASAFSGFPISEGVVDTKSLVSSFQKRMVDLDLKKLLPAVLKEMEYDLLLVDLIDERFPLLMESNTQICTGSVELVRTGVDIDSCFQNTVPSGTDDHFRLWQNGWDAFILHMKNLKKIDKILLNKVFWSDRTEDGQDLNKIYTQDRIGKANRYLQKMYDYAEVTLPRHQIMGFDQSAFVADSKHTWGLSPFHYTNAYYKSAFEFIKV